MPRARKEPDVGDSLTVSQARTLTLRDRECILADTIFEEVVIEPGSVGTLKIENCVLRKVEFSSLTISTLRLRDVRLVECDLANVETRELVALRAELVNCRMTGFRATEATDCQDLLISGGTQRYSVFSAARFRSSEFGDGDLEEASSRRRTCEVASSARATCATPT